MSYYKIYMRKKREQKVSVYFRYLSLFKTVILYLLFEKEAKGMFG